jgi:DNA primase
LISRATIDKVFEISRLEEVIGDFVQLKKSGSNFKGLSPFTDERTPSFMVSPAKQIWKDFSSGKGGNVISFLMEHEHFTYPEAIRFLAKKYGLEVEETIQTDEQKEKASERESLYLISEFARDYYHDTLLNADEGKAIGLSYFKERGFTDDIIKKFKLGYSLNQWDAFTQIATKEGYSVSYLEKTGLTIVNADKQFDRFKGRVMFPIHSMSGRTLGFGGRILTNDKKQAKYINSPESDIYHKSKVLYGIFFAKQSIVKEDNCYLVEGYTDVIQLYQMGIQNVVSSSGTALTEDQIRLIRRLTNNITVLFDGDAAGVRASLRGIDLILEQGLNVRICTFPEGEDPDSFARKNSYEELTGYLKDHSQDFIAFKASLLASETKNDPIKRAETIRDIVVSIAKIPDVIKREVYIKECSRIMDISEEVLFNTQAQILLKEERDRGKKVQKPTQVFEVIPKEPAASAKKIDRQFELERKIIELLLLYGVMEEDFEDVTIEANDEGEIGYKQEVFKAKVFEKIYLDLQEDEIEFANEDFKELYFEIIDHYNREQDMKLDQFISKLKPEKAETITHLLMEDEKYNLHEWNRKDIFVKDKKFNISQLVNETILNLRRHLVTQKINDLSIGFKENETKDNDTRLTNIVDYITLKKILSDKLNRVL